MKFEMLKDGTTVFLREVTAGDHDRSLRFFKSLPTDDRRYLRVDVTQSEVVSRRIRQGVSGEVYRLMALVEDEIVGDGALEYSQDHWRGHLGEIRVIVSHDFRGKGLAKIFIRELFKVAENREIEKVVVKILAPQTSVRLICEKLGFRVEAEVPEYAKDLDGNLQSLVIMSCTLDDWYHGMKDVYKESSWPDG